MIVNGYNEMKPYLPPIEMKGTPTLFNDALQVAQEDLTAQIIGTNLEQLLEQRKQEDHKLFVLCQRIIACDAFLHSIPEMDLVLTDAGFGVVNNQSFAPASRERINNLTTAMQRKVDDGRDRLVVFLVRTGQYDDWRGTEEFARLSDGLFLTLVDFRDAAVLNPITAPVWPNTWSDFLKMNGALNVALMSDVASYISTEYAEEILEKIRDKETFLPIENKVLKLIKEATAAIAMGDRPTGVQQAIKAARIMKDNPDDFPTFNESSASHDLTIEYTDTPIFSLV